MRTKINAVQTHLRYALSLSCAWWVAAGAVTPASAQVFPPQGDDVMSSMGVFKVLVAPPFRSLLAPDVGFNGYPGYHSADGRLTSPLLIDNMTTVGRSAPHDRPLAGSLNVGVPTMGLVGYPDYPLIPALFSGAAPGTREILTQIRSFALMSAGDRQCTNNDPRVPMVPIAWRMIYAGPGQGVARRSIGMVQERIVNGAPPPDFPARSFFDIFVEANLPPVPGTKSTLAFPATGAVLYNDAPLVITNLDLAFLPPQVVYIHGETTAVPLKFKNNNPPYWFADDVFGYLVLAGHGTQIDCNNEPALTAFLNTVLGPIGTSAHELPIEWPFPTDLCPAPDSIYSSVSEIDTIAFPVPGVNALRARSFRHSKLSNPIPPPPPGTAAIYTSPATLVDFEFTIDGLNWFAGQATGPVAVSIRHSSDDANTRFFDTEMLQLDLIGNTPLGPFLLRESPTRQSLGKHTIRKTTQGLLISGFFDVFLEASIDGGATFAPADRAIRVQLDNAPCGAAGANLHLTRSGTALTLAWSDPSYRLQSTTTLGSASGWMDIPGPSPVVVNGPLAENRFYRLICP